MIDDIINVEERASNRRRNNIFGGLVGNLMTLEEIIQHISENDVK